MEGGPPLFIFSTFQSSFTCWVRYAPVFEAARQNGSPLVALNPATEVASVGN